MKWPPVASLNKIMRNWSWARIPAAPRSLHRDLSEENTRTPPQPASLWPPAAPSGKHTRKQISAGIPAVPRKGKNTKTASQPAPLWPPTVAAQGNLFNALPAGIPVASRCLGVTRWDNCFNTAARGCSAAMVINGVKIIQVAKIVKVVTQSFSCCWGC